MIHRWILGEDDTDLGRVIREAVAKEQDAIEMRIRAEAEDWRGNSEVARTALVAVADWLRTRRSSKRRLEEEDGAIDRRECRCHICHTREKGCRVLLGADEIPCGKPVHGATDFCEHHLAEVRRSSPNLRVPGDGT